MSLGGLALVAAVALVAVLVVARAPWPPGVFPKYLVLVQDTQVAAGRSSDLSPLYAGLARALGDHAREGLLWLQCALHALTALALAVVVARWAGRRWGLAAGLATALHPPLLVHAGIHEPETLIAALLAGALLAGQRVRGAAAATGAPAATGATGATGASGATGTTIAWAVAAGLLCGLAALARPHHVLLAPAWAAWTAWTGTSRGGRRSADLRIAFVVLASALAPVLLTSAARRWSGQGVVVMNPGPVFHEGNAPAASGITRHAPLAVQWIERRHPESIDHAHVAYRQVAAAAAGRPLSVAESNAWWLELTLEGARAHPRETVTRLLRKAVFAFSPREWHDLRVGEDLQRRVQAMLPWGAGLLFAGLAWLPLARRRRWGDLAGPLAIVAVAWGIQVAFYCSARQRLPMSVAFLVITPVLAADLWNGSLRGSVRRGVGLAAGLAVVLLLAFASGRHAFLDALGWDAAGARPEQGPGRMLAALGDGRLLRPAGEREDLALLRRSIESLRAGGGLDPRLADLAGRGLDASLDDRTIGVPEFWLGLVAHGEEGRAYAAQAWAVRPQDPLVFALARARGALPADAAPPAGSDPVSIACALAAVTQDPAPLAPWVDALPELAAAPRGP